MEFEELKQDLLDRAKKANACQEGYRMGLNAKSKVDLLNAITKNWFWVLRLSKIIDVNYLEENFTEEELAEAGIYTRKEHVVRTATFACGSATVEACGSATVEACGSATVRACGSATVKACDSATVEACGSATVKAYDSATVRAYDSATVEACDSATVKACDSATVEACDSATVEACDSATVKAYDSATVKAYGSATVEACGSATVEAYENSYVEDCTRNIKPKSDYAIVKDYYSHKIYIKKGKFEIIEVE
ncbi:hypothetical protein [Parabacteroides johnsonii]|uniref:hypothetical protein n=1 Tax=Parabacteroides johnsonii TaxID=387661 RepID=UPI001651E2A2|nr:hypothetical protein [Parabacteroides johnsonii]